MNPWAFAAGLFFGVLCGVIGLVELAYAWDRDEGGED